MLLLFSLLVMTTILRWKSAVILFLSSLTVVKVLFHSIGYACYLYRGDTLQLLNWVGAWVSNMKLKFNTAHCK